MWLLLAGLIGFGVAVWRLRRCRHPNPHYVKPILRDDPVAGSVDVVQPASYICYECGRTWIAAQRDPAWRPTALLRKFTGYDANKAGRAATRASIEAEQRRFLADRRATSASTTVTSGNPAPTRPAKRRRAAKIVELGSHKPGRASASRLRAFGR